MLSAVRSKDADGVVVLSGPEGWAWEYTHLAHYASESDLHMVMFSLHPYMGPWQDCDPAFDKSPEGLATAVDVLQAAGHPVILTEVPQLHQVASIATDANSHHRHPAQPRLTLAWTVLLPRSGELRHRHRRVLRQCRCGWS